MSMYMLIYMSTHMSIHTSTEISIEMSICKSIDISLRPAQPQSLHSCCAVAGTATVAARATFLPQWPCSHSYDNPHQLSARQIPLELTRQMATSPLRLCMPMHMSMHMSKDMSICESWYLCFNTLVGPSSCWDRHHRESHCTVYRNDQFRAPSYGL